MVSLGKEKRFRRINSRNLELVDELFHEPVTVGIVREVQVTFSFDINPCRLTVDAWDMVHGNAVSACLVFSSREEANRDVLD